LEYLIMNGAFLIPIVAIVFGIGMGALGLWTDHKRKSQMMEQQHRERMAAIEKGITLPPATVDAQGTPAPSVVNPVDPAKVLRSGVLFLALGIVLYFAIGGAGGNSGALFGLIPATVGLANLAYAFVLFRNERKAMEEKERARLGAHPEI
jgi:hypothetical protein